MNQMPPSQWQGQIMPSERDEAIAAAVLAERERCCRIIERELQHEYARAVERLLEKIRGAA